MTRQKGRTVVWDVVYVAITRKIASGHILIAPRGSARCTGAIVTTTNTSARSLPQLGLRSMWEFSSSGGMAVTGLDCELVYYGIPPAG